MLGYGKDSHTYRVFNTYHNKVVETVDVYLNETNGSQREHMPPVLDEMPPEESIKLMGTGGIVPSEEIAEEEVIIPHPEETDAPEENDSEENAQRQQGPRPAHPRVANEVQFENPRQQKCTRSHHLLKSFTSG